MNQHVQDPFEKIAARGGFTEEFLAKAKARKEAEEERQRIEAQRKKVVEALQKTGCPESARKIIIETAERHGVDPMDMLVSWKRNIVPIRDEALYAIKKARPILSCTRVAKWIGRDHTTILASWARHAARHGLPRFTALDHEHRRNLWRNAPSRASRSGAEKARA